MVQSGTGLAKTMGDLIDIKQKEEPRRDESPDGDGRGNNLNARVAVLEAELKHLATKTDIANLKLWIVFTVLGGGFIMVLQIIGIVIALYITFAG